MTSLCGAIADADLARLAAAAVQRGYHKGKVFIVEGDPADDFFTVRRGTVKLFKLLSDGRQQVTGFVGMGHLLGLAGNGTYAFSAQAIEPVRVCRFSRRKLRVVLDDFPLLETRLLHIACNELVVAQERMLMLGRKTARERAAGFLLCWSAASGPYDGAAGHTHLPMTRGEIADHLELTIETASRIMSRFRADGRITTSSTTDVVLVDRPWLEGLAAGTC